MANLTDGDCGARTDRNATSLALLVNRDLQGSLGDDPSNRPVVAILLQIFTIWAGCVR
jgi:hypothetical protein